MGGPMDLRTALLARRTVRAYKPDPVPEALLTDLLELANWAPSAGNLQARDFFIVRDQEARRSLARAALDQDFLTHAPAIVVVCANLARIQKYGKRGRDLFAIQDAAAATENLLLAAHEAKLGAAWVGAFEEGTVSRLLGIPMHARPVALIPMGLPAEIPEPSTRLPIQDLLHWDRW